MMILKLMQASGGKNSIMSGQITYHGKAKVCYALSVGEAIFIGFNLPP